MNRGPMKFCPKCGNYHIAGPRYIKHTLDVPSYQDSYECLVYTCTRCGYLQEVATLDVKEGLNK